MKLHLSSYRVPVPEALFELLPMPPMECRMAIIPNAKDYKDPVERARSLDDLIVDLGGFGFKSEVVDLRDYEDPGLLRQKLETFPIIWMAGGNTFSLRSEMNRAGMDSFLNELIMNGMVYCGESAGAIVAGMTLEGSEEADDPDLADNYLSDGLRLINKIVAPHADSAETEYVTYINAMKKRYPDDPRVLYLGNSQAYIINGTSEKLVSKS